MAYILKENLALRQWPDGCRVIVRGDYARSVRVDEKLYARLCKLDGTADGTPPNIGAYLALGFAEECAPCEKALTPWQRSITYDTPYTPLLKIAVTERCNYNCLHCYNAVDNLPISAELTAAQIMDILDQARDCGVQGISLTGGEPMLHRDFLPIVEGIYARGMYLYELCTNGSLITREILDCLKSLDARPEMKISFDGIGYHEWMRNVKGCEKTTLEKLRLCIDCGFRIGVHFNVNRENRDCVMPTLRLLDDMGVHFCKLLPTTPAPRWEQNAAGRTFTPEEYVQLALDTAGEYLKEPHNMDLQFWQLFDMSMADRRYCFHKSHDPKTFDENCFNCGLAALMPAISSMGRVYPCLQSSGYFDANGVPVDSIFTTPLRELLLHGSRPDFLKRYSMGRRARTNGVCINCEHFKRCGGGSYCVSGAYCGGDLDHPDPFQCLLYKEGYARRIIALFAGRDAAWKNTSPDQSSC